MTQGHRRRWSLLAGGARAYQREGLNRPRTARRLPHGFVDVALPKRYVDYLFGPPGRARSAGASAMGSHRRRSPSRLHG